MNGDAASSSGSNATRSAQANRGRFSYHHLRRASFISPATGKRSKRIFTLREASSRPNEEASESTPLLSNDQDDHGGPRRMSCAISYFRTRWSEFYDFANSRTGRGIFKCSLAYFLGSLVTFVPPIAALIGNQQDSKHMVATVTVWFHPARSIGSMHEATVLGFFGFLYSGFLGFSSMGVSMFFRSHDLLTLGHVLILIIFVGGGMGSIAWTKQHFSSPLVNVACSLASLGCVTILVKEGSVQVGEFSTGRVVQILLMVLMGVVVATAVNVLVLPITARQQLRKDFEKNTDLLGEVLISITRAFLSGREEDLQDEYFTKLSKEHQQSLQKMSKDLEEAKNENYLIGKEKGFEVSTRLANCLDGLAQDLGGLRSAAFAQFALIKSNQAESKVPQLFGQIEQETEGSKGQRGSTTQVPSILGVITEAPDDNLESPNTVDAANNPFDLINGTSPNSPIDNTLARQLSASSAKVNLESPADMFFAFLRQVGPPTKSLVYTLKQILDELPYKKRTSRSSGLKAWLLPEVEVAVNENFHSSLRDAVDLYRASRKEALNTLYTSRALRAAFMPLNGKKSGAFSRQHTTTKPGTDVRNPITSEPVDSAVKRLPEEFLADIEEVSACCGHFSFSLLDFAENVLLYLDILDDLWEITENPRFTWNWLKFWRINWHEDRLKKFRSSTDLEHSDEHDTNHIIPEPIRKADKFADPEKGLREQPWYYKVYKMLRPFRRDDVRFAIKVGVGAVLYALPAFIRTSRPFFVRWRGEWGLISYMAVCCMTVGASNTTGINRFIGTGIGAVLAIVAWILAADDGDANPYLLAFFGWLVASGCFYLILAKGQGPMGRFILLTYNLGALYAFSLSVHDDDHDDDEGGVSPEIFPIVGHRLVAVIVGAVWGVVVTRMIWPNSARKKLKDGLCVLWLRMSLVWKRDPLAMFLLGEPRSSYMDIREEAELQSFLTYLESLQSAAKSEFELRGPFPAKIISRVAERTRRMLDAFHAMNVVITKNLQCTPGEAALFRYTREQRFALSARISHLFSVIASSFKLEYPLNDVLPSIENSRDQLLSSISEFRRTAEERDVTTEQDYELLYAYVLVTGQLAQDLEAISHEVELLFGTLNEENLKLQ